MGQAAVFIKGQKETLSALRKIDPELAKQLNKRMNDGAKKITGRAKQKVPPRVIANYGQWTRQRDGGDLNWDPNTVKKGLKHSRSGGRGSAAGRGIKGVATFKLVNQSAAGAMFEMAGSRGGRSPQGRAFVSTISGRYGKEPRLLVETWRSMKGITMMAAIAHECAEAAEEAVRKAMPGGR